jgi:hypothetical protein
MKLKTHLSLVSKLKRAPLLLRPLYAFMSWRLGSGAPGLVLRDLKKISWKSVYGIRFVFGHAFLFPLGPFCRILRYD